MALHPYSVEKICVVTMISTSLNDYKSKQFDMINIITHSESAKFFTFIYNQDELTLYYDKAMEQYVSLYDCIRRHDHVCYKISNLCDLMDESGCINTLTSIFTQQKIPILYLTAFNNDNILIPIEYETEADKLLGI